MAISSSRTSLDINESSMFEYEKIDYDVHDFRLLKLLAGQDGDVQCEIHPAAFGSQPYEALSYCWGSLELVEDIVVNGKTLMITDSLSAALRRLRHPSQDRILWVDAICINQNDVVERSEQVRRMGQVFANAEQVVIWLGKATVEVKFLMRWLKGFEERRFNFDEVLGITDQVKRRIGLLTLLIRPWFKRVWILQEVANAKSAVVCAGGEHISAATFAQAAITIEPQMDQHCRAVLGLMPGSHVEGPSPDEARDLCSLLTRFKASKASDERDKIYALLAMSTDPDDAKSLVPDYTVPTEKVIHDTVRYLFRKHNCSVVTVLEILARFNSVVVTSLWPIPDILSALGSLSTWVQDAFDAIASENKASMMCIEAAPSTSNELDTCWEQAGQLKVGGFRELDGDLSLLQLSAYSGSDLWPNLKLIGFRYITIAIERAMELHVGSVIDLLLDNGIAHLGGEGFMAWLWTLAIDRRNGELLRDILERSVDVNAQFDNSFFNYGWRYTDKPNTPLQYASFKSYLPGVQALIEAGAELERRNIDGYTALHLARSVAVAEMLIDAGANVNARADPAVRDGLPIYRALGFAGSWEVLKPLIQAGADVNLKNMDHETPLQMVMKERIGRHGAGRELDAMKMLIAAGADPDWRLTERDHETVLFTAAKHGDEEAIKTLIDLGADMNLPNRYGETPLEVAIRSRHPGTAQILRDAGARLRNPAERHLSTLPGQKQGH